MVIPLCLKFREDKMIEAIKKAMMPKEEKAIFEESTRCPDCNSDKIYVFQDSDGGLCIQCKAMLTGIIKGGLSKMEVMRLRGDIKGAEAQQTQNDIDKKADAAVKASEDVAKLKKDMAALGSLGKSQSMPVVKEAPKTPQRETVKGPSVIEKAKAFLFGGDKGKATGPQAAPPPPAPAPPPIMVRKADPPPPVAAPVAVPDKKETGLPGYGQRWTVGPCGPCGIRNKTVGTVVRSKSTGTSRYFLELDNGYHGCFFCAKKS
jgi:hypothetical protein